MDPRQSPANARSSSYFNAVSEIDRIVFRIIAERRASGSDEGDLLSMLLEAQDEDGTQMNDAQLRDEVMTLFLAGHETTALSLSWSWYLLASHLRRKKFHAELDEVLGGRTPDVSDLPNLKYTEMIAKEAMRLYPAYAVGREAIEDTELGGFHVPKGTQVFAFQWATHRDARYFEDPASFKPERWTNGASEQLPVRLLPFRRWTAAMYRQLLRDDGDRLAARDDRSAI